MEDAERGVITSVVSTLAPLNQITVAWSVMWECVCVCDREEYVHVTGCGVCM